MTGTRVAEERRAFSFSSAGAGEAESSRLAEEPGDL
jgi:hypothetical protein